VVVTTVVTYVMHVVARYAPPSMKTTHKRNKMPAARWLVAIPLNEKHHGPKLEVVLEVVFSQSALVVVVPHLTTGGPIDRIGNVKPSPILTPACFGHAATTTILPDLVSHQLAHLVAPKIWVYIVGGNLRGSRRPTPHGACGLITISISLRLKAAARSGTRLQTDRLAEFRDGRVPILMCQINVFGVEQRILTMNADKKIAQGNQSGGAVEHDVAAG